MHTNNDFKNPYDDYPEWLDDRTTRLVSRVPVSEFNFFYNIHPTKGVVQTVVNNLLLKLTNALKQRNITSIVEQQRFIDFVLRSELVVPSERRPAVDVVERATASSTVPETNGPDDRSRVKKRAVTNKGNAGRAKPLQSRSGGRSKRPDNDSNQSQ